MAHKVFDVGGEGITGHVAGATEGRVWIRREKTGGTELVAIDAETGRETHHWPLEPGHPFLPSFFATKTGALVLHGRQTQHVDVKTGAAGPRVDAIPISVDGENGTAVLAAGEPHELRKVGLPALDVLARNGVPGYLPSFGSLGATAGGKLLYKCGDEILCVDADTLRTRWVHDLGPGRFDWHVFSVRGDAFAARLVDTREGPTTVLAAWGLEDGRLTDVATLRGRMTAHSSGGDFLVAEMAHADESAEVIAWKPGEAAPAFVVPLRDRGWVQQCQVHGSIGAAIHRGGMEVFALRDGRLAGTRVPLPEHFTPTVAVWGRHVFAFTGALHVVDAGILPFDTEMKAQDIVFEGTPPRTVPASTLDIDVYTPPPGRNLQVLRESAERFGFVVPPLLAKMLDLYDRNPVVRSWIRASGLEMSVSGFAECWIGTDPALLGFAGDGSGQQWALYVYPPGMKPGAECGVAYWDHETRGISWCGSTFEVFLSEHFDRMSQDEPAKLELLLEALGLPPDFPREDRSSSWPPPEFFQQAHGEDTRGTTLDAANAAIEADPIRGERALVAYVRENELDDAGIATMEQLYERLGWRFHRENLRHMKHVASR